MKNTAYQVVLTRAVLFLLDKEMKHGDGPRSRQAQLHIECLEEAAGPDLPAVSEVKPVEAKPEKVKTPTKAEKAAAAATQSDTPKEEAEPAKEPAS